MRANCKNIKFKVLSVETLRLENNFTDVKSMSGSFKETLNELFIIYLSIPDSSSIHMFPGIRILLSVPGVSCSHVHPSLCTLKSFLLFVSELLYSLISVWRISHDYGVMHFLPIFNKQMAEKQNTIFVYFVFERRADL